MAVYRPPSFGVRPVPPRPPISAPRSPNNRAGPLGAGPQFGLSTQSAAKPAFTPDQVTASLAANPQASRGGYEVGPPMGGATGGGPAGPAVQPHMPNPAPVKPITAPTLAYDYNSDPILQQVRGLSTKQRGDATSGALKLRKQTAIDYGDPEAAALWGDPSTVEAATNNPFSVRAQLKTGYDRGVGQLEEGYNQGNLWYGGARAKGLGDFAHDYQGQLAGAGTEEQKIFGGIGDNLQQALSAADLQDITALGPAADRGIAKALATGVDPGAAPPPDAGTAPPDLFAPPAAPGVDASLAANPGASMTYGVDANGQPIPGIDPMAAPNILDALAGGAVPNVGDVAPLPVGATNNPLIYALMGRKMDPRYNF